MFASASNDGVRSTGLRVPDLLPRHALRGRAPRPASGPGMSRRVEHLGDFLSWRAAASFGALYLVGISNGAVMTLVLIGLLVWATRGPRQAIMAMSVVAMYRITNGTIASFSPFANVLFWLVAIVGSLRLFLSLRQMIAPFVWITLFALVAALLSLAVSQAPDVSLMKVVSFYVVAAAVLVSSGALRAADVAWLQRWFFTIALFMAVGSILTAAIPAIGFRKVAGSLQGMFTHPQVAGVFYVPFAAWFLARVFVEPWRLLPRWVLAAAILFSGLLLASDARTAMLATFLSVGLTILVLLAKGRTGPQTRSRGQIMGVGVLMGLLSVALLASGVLSEQIEEAILKGDDTESVGEAFYSSRGAGIEQHLRNFRDAPLTGHGFGVYRYGVRGGEERVRRFMGIPFSASTEKGVVFTSVLEEVGIFGGILFYGLLISILGGVARGEGLGAFAMVAGCIAVNFGEASIFSAGGMGLWTWLLIGFGLARSRFGPVILETGGAGVPPRSRSRVLSRSSPDTMPTVGADRASS